MERLLLEKIKHIFLKNGWSHLVEYPPLTFDYDRERSSLLLMNQISGNNSLMVSRFGSVELQLIISNAVKHRNHSVIGYITGKHPAYWHKDKYIFEIQNNASFFPANDTCLDKFSDLYFQSSLQIDILASWREEEYEIRRYLSPHIKKIWITNLEPFWSETPYTSALKGKRVLVVHPFAETIKKQYEKRALLHHHPDTLPEFSNFFVIPAVQSLGGKADGFETWFDALHYMENEIDKHDYEVCLIGCGAYGLPLAAHVKRQGKKAIHIGGALQLLFGIMGKRWIDFEPFMLDGKLIDYSTLPNKHWVTPSETERPKNYKNVENGCYW